MFVLLVGSGCDTKSQNDAKEDGKIRIVTTTGMITDVVKNVGGEKVDVIGLMGPGIDPHLYKATGKDIERLTSADIIFYNGLHLESKMADVFGNMSGDTKSFAVAESVSKESLLPLPDSNGHYDPHLWFDVSLWMKVVENVRDTLIEYKPDIKADVSRNAKQYLDELTQLHQDVKAQVERIPVEQRVLITAHDAFNYFGNAYGFEVRGLQGISTVAKASIADVQQLATFITERRIPAIFVETSVSVKNLEAVKDAVKSKGYDVEIGGELFSDAMGGEGTPEGTYIGMVRHNIDTIVSALGIDVETQNTHTEEN
ncbi:manganese transporter [Candidatus Poribacteria bacterium]|nr:manganese transporter [Candidatus Poribacteria bacterium]MYB63562.1 manganese transporter [Candidatus Poribacteria bacterium]MYF56545.1 manganese transporter [Candidatus Poribacteria bacterium]